jgi:hypothetical protein
MAGESRLDNFDRDVAVALSGAPPELRRRVAEFAADWAIARTGLAHPALAGGSVDSVAALVAELDDRYFALSAERDAGRASPEEVAAAFGRARAASAVEFMLREEPAEAVYEAAAAAEDWSGMRAEVMSLLGSQRPADPGTAPDRGGA